MVLFGLAAMLFGVAIVSAILTKSDAWSDVNGTCLLLGAFAAAQASVFEQQSE